MDREAVYVALWDRLRTVGDTRVLTRSRKPRPVGEVPTQEQPAMFLEQQSATVETAPGMPGVHILRVTALVYVYVDETEAGPFPLLNALVTEIEEALKAQTGEVTSRYPAPTTLGGLVRSARVVEINTGGLNGPQGTAAVDIEILVAG